MKTKLRRRAGVEAMTTDGDHEDTRRSGGDDCPEVDSRQREATFHHRAPRRGASVTIGHIGQPTHESI